MKERKVTFEIKRTQSGRHYCKVIQGEQVVYVTQGNHQSGEEAIREARQALTNAYQIGRALA